MSHLMINMWSQSAENDRCVESGSFEYDFLSKSDENAEMPKTAFRIQSREK